MSKDEGVKGATLIQPTVGKKSPSIASAKKSLADLLKRDGATSTNARGGRTVDEKLILSIEAELAKHPENRKKLSNFMEETGGDINSLAAQLEITMPDIEPATLKAGIITFIETSKMTNLIKKFMYKNPKLRKSLRDKPTVNEAVLKQFTQLFPVKNWSMLKECFEEYNEYTSKAEAYFAELNEKPSADRVVEDVSDEAVKKLVSEHPQLNEKRMKTYLQEFQEFSFAAKKVRELFLKNKEMLRRLQDSNKFQASVLTRAKPGEKQDRKAKEAVNQLRAYGDALKAKLLQELMQELPGLSKDAVLGGLYEMEDVPYPSEPCVFQDILFEKSSDGTSFKNHNLASYALSFVSVEELVLLRECSKVLEDFIDMHLRKILASLPFSLEKTYSNISYWLMAIRFFFRNGSSLVPINRLKCKLSLNALKTCRATFPIVSDGMNSTLLVTLDRLLPEHILYCTHKDPMPHTCSAKRELKGPRVATQQEISIAQFVKEYLDRVQFNNDELFWNMLGNQANVKFLAFLLWQFLRCMHRSVLAQKGVCSIKRIEYLVHDHQRIFHRIWLQVTYKWGVQQAGEYSKSLYLTIADHFRWDA